MRTISASRTSTDEKMASGGSYIAMAAVGRAPSKGTDALLALSHSFLTD